MSAFRQALENPDVREVHAQPKREFLPITAEHGAWQADIMFYPGLESQNKGYNGILNFVSIGTRFAYCVPVKTKDGGEVSGAIEQFLNEAKKGGRDVTRLETDGGKEFDNSKVKALLAQHKVKFCPTNPNDSKRKQGIVERFNGTCRNWLGRWMTSQQTDNWIDAMPELMEYYNSRQQRTMGAAPEDVTVDKEREIKAKLDDRAAPLRDRVNNIKPGDRVRLLQNKGKFTKGKLRWSDMVHVIEGRTGNKFTVEGSSVLYPYSSIQKVGVSSSDIDKSPIVAQAAARYTHAKNLGRSGLARGPNEASRLIDAVEGMPKERPVRDRVPSRRQLEHDEPQNQPRPRHHMPDLAPLVSRPEPEPRRSARVRAAPDRLGWDQ